MTRLYCIAYLFDQRGTAGQLPQVQISRLDVGQSNAAYLVGFIC